jgi:hypothetical protein
MKLFRLHAAIADSYRSFLKLWYWCRAIDTTGCGIVEIDTAIVAEQLGVSARTIVNYIKAGKSLYHHIVKLAPGQYKLYLKSLITVTKQRGLETFGAVAEVTIEQLKTLKITATEITALGGQKSSKYRAKSRHEQPTKMGDCKPKKQPPKHVVSSIDIFNGTGLEKVEGEKTASHLCPGALVFDPLHSTLFVASRFNHYGISQQYIADKLHRNRRTINRRLRKTTKLQIAKFDPANAIEREIAGEENSPQGGRFIKISRALDVAPKLRGLTFKLLTNIYYPKYDLVSMMSSRKELNKLLEKQIETVAFGCSESIRR